MEGSSTMKHLQHLLNTILWVSCCESAHINLENKKFLVDGVSGHGGLLSITVWDVVSLDVHLHLLLLQMQQQLKLL